jgi:hypothetical protein
MTGPFLLRVPAVALVIALSPVLALIVATPASAATCTTFEKLTNGDIGAGGGFVNARYGSRANLTVENRDLNTDCAPQYSMSGSTAVIGFTADALNWVGAGWAEGWDGPQWHWEVLITLNGNVVRNFGSRNTWPCTVNVGDAPEFKISSGSGTDWHGYINCEDGTGAHPLYTVTQTGFTEGRPQGMVWRDGGTATGAADSTTNLETEASDGTWALFNDNGCWLIGTDMSNWQANRTSASSFDTSRTSSPVCSS